MRILIIRLSAIGDTIHCLPAVDVLKRRIPGVEISWLVEPAGAPLLEHNPVVDVVHVLPRKAWLSDMRAPWRWPATLTEAGAFWSGLRRQEFDAAVDFQGLLKSALCASLSGAPVRIGFKGTREGAEHLLTDRLDIGDYFGPDRHVVDLNLALADFVIKRLGGSAAANDPVFPLPEPPVEAVERFRHLLDPDGGTAPAPVAVLIPGTTWDTKIWPLDKWRKLAQLLIVERGYRLCLVGGPGESKDNADLAAWLHRECPESGALDLTGQTSLMDLVALFRQCRLVVGGDTGPLHLAAATGVPAVVGIYGSTPWLRNGPYGRRCAATALSLWCQPCFEKRCPLSTKACLHDLTPERVLADIDGLLAG